MPNLEKPITTEDELEQAVQAAIGQRCPDYEALKENAGKLPGLEAENSRLKAALLRVKVAHEAGLPHELAHRLTGEKEADLRRDAEALRTLVRRQNPGSPMFEAEPAPGRRAGGFSRTKHIPRNWPVSNNFD